MTDEVPEIDIQAERAWLRGPEATTVGPHARPRIAMQATLAHTDDLIIDLRKQLLMGVVARVANAGKRLDHEHMAAVATRILGDEVTASELKELQDEVPDLFKRRPVPEFEERRKPHQQADRVVLLVANWHLRPLAAAGGED